MANFTKYKAYSVGRLMQHNNRTYDDGVTHSNTDIDNNRTIFNYHYKKGGVEDITKRLDEVFSLRRKDGTILGEMVVTLPKDVKKQDERAFFGIVYDFFVSDFGEKNIINAVVHKDEKTPHIHIDFVPVVTSELEYTTRGKQALEDWKKAHNKENEKVIERLCCKDLINRAYLKGMHPRLYDYVAKNLGYEVEILNGATAGGNRTVQQMKNEKADAELREKQAAIENLKADILVLKRYAAEYGLPKEDYGLIPLLQKITVLEERNTILSNIIKKSGLTYSGDDLARLRSLSIISKSASVNIIDDVLATEDTPTDAIIIGDIMDKNERPFSDAIMRDFEFKRCADALTRIPNNTIIKNARMTNRTYCLYKTDDSEQTITNLLELRQHMLEEDDRFKKRGVYMQVSEFDNFYFSKNFLEQLPCQGYLYMKHKVEDEKEKIREKEIDL